MNADFDITGLILNTPRLLLRPWLQDDLNDFYEYAKVDGVGQMAGWAPHESIENTQLILDLFIKEKKTFAIYHKADGKVIGSLGIEMYNTVVLSEFDQLRGREIGYVLSKDYWGQGLMAEAVKAVIEYLFDSLKYDFLLCGHFLFNRQSARVQEKCNFQPYRRLVFTTRTGREEDAEMTLLLNPVKDVEFEAIHPETLVYKPFVKTAEQLWAEYCSYSGTKNETYEAWEFGASPDKLAGLILKGEKRATTSQFQLYESEGEELPRVGEYSVILNSAGYAVCVIKNTDVQIKRFCDIDSDYAFTEGEGDKSLQYWKQVHLDIFSKELKEETGKDFTEEDKVVCEIFEVCFPKTGCQR